MSDEEPPTYESIFGQEGSTTESNGPVILIPSAPTQYEINISSTDYWLLRIFTGDAIYMQHIMIIY